MVVLDIKQENFELTSGFRARYGQSVYLFNPFAEDRRTHRWNPLSYVSRDPAFRISDVQSIAAMLYPVSDLHKDPFWANHAQNAFVAFALYAYEQAAYLAEQYGVPFQEPTMGGLYRLASGRPGQEFKAYLAELAAWPHLSEPSARTAFATLLGQANETFASIMGTFKEPLNPWLNPVVDAATSGKRLRPARRAQEEDEHLRRYPAQQAGREPPDPQPVLQPADQPEHARAAAGQSRAQAPVPAADGRVHQHRPASTSSPAR